MQDKGIDYEAHRYHAEHQDAEPGEGLWLSGIFLVLAVCFAYGGWAIYAAVTR